MNELTISHVTWSSLGGGGYKFVSATDLLLDPVVGPSGNFIGLDFTPLNNAFTVPVGQIMDGTLRYIVDPPPPILDGSSVSLDPIGYSELDVSIYYGTKLPGQTHPSTLQNLSFSTSNRSTSLYTLDTGVHPFAPSNYIDVTVEIIIGDGTIASSSGGGQSTIYSSASLVTPEPAAFGFVGIGLGGLLVLRRKLVRM